MGVWSTSITGNDTAMDLASEYTAAFYYYDIPEALAKIEDYVRADGFDESDEAEWCNYVYSLADFMWRKGILTDDFLRRTLGMIDSGFGLDAWAQEGSSMLKARNKVLEKFRAKITSPQPPRKKIKPDIYTEDIFTNGDVIAIQLQTAGKSYVRSEIHPLSDDFFHSLDGKYILLQKVGCHISWTSRIVPEVKDHWPDFRLFHGIYDSIPQQINYKSLKTVKFKQGDSLVDAFSCESSLFYFKKRKYQLLGNYPVPSSYRSGSLYFSINSDFYNPDSELVAALTKKRFLW